MLLRLRSHFELLLAVLFLTVSGCGTASEQEVNRKKLIEGLNDHRVKRVTEQQIHTEAYVQGKQIVEVLDLKQQDTLFWSSSQGRAFLDSLNGSFAHGGIQLLTKNFAAPEVNQDQQAILEAYQYSSDQGQLPGDNVQSFEDDYLLYTAPIIKDNVFIGMWSIKLSRKELVRSL